MLRAIEPHVPPGYKLECVDRVLMMAPRPSEAHGVTHDSLGFWLRDSFAERNPRRRGPGGWLLRSEPEVHLGATPDVCVPDLAGWRIDRAPTDADAVAITVVPAWVCEVLSPSTERYDRSVKADCYARHGVAFLWLVDPIERAIEVYAPRDGAMVLRARAAARDIARLPPFDAEPLSLSELWFAPESAGR
jgi:Uma2 family endonuclease